MLSIVSPVDRNFPRYIYIWHGSYVRTRFGVANSLRTLFLKAMLDSGRGRRGKYFHNEEYLTIKCLF